MNRLVILFAVLSGFAFGLDIKQSLTERCNNMYELLTFAVKDNSNRGYDYFALTLNNTRQRVEYLRASIASIPQTSTSEQVRPFIDEVDKIEKELPFQLRFPALREIFKGGALYFSIMKEVGHDSSLPTPAELRLKVSNIIIQEGTIQEFGLSPAEHKMAKQASMKLDEMYGDLLKDLKDRSIPTPEDFSKLEYDMTLKIQDLKQHNKQEEAKKCQEALNKFHTSTYFIGKIFPLNSQTRFTQFIQAAPEQYKDYLALKVLFWAH